MYTDTQTYKTHIYKTHRYTYKTHRNTQIYIETHRDTYRHRHTDIPKDTHTQAVKFFPPLASPPALHRVKIIQPFGDRLAPFHLTGRSQNPKWLSWGGLCTSQADPGVFLSSPNGWGWGRVTQTSRRR